MQWQDSPDERLTFTDSPSGADPGLGMRTYVHGNYTQARLNGRKVGDLIVAPWDRTQLDKFNQTVDEPLQPGEIGNIFVHQDQQGRGIARALAQHAQELGWDPRHSRSLLPDGRGFARATPEFGMVPPVPKRKSV
jgi:GNAT superfamily N-acetyltransferase